MSRYENCEKAKKHVKMVSAKYADKVKECVNKSKIYKDGVCEEVVVTEFFDTEYSLMKCTTQQALKSIKSDEKICLLNFASFKHAGGGFIRGSMAQEESLCHDSILYNVLSNKKFEDEFYSKNLSRLNNSLYTSDLIYTPNVLFTSCNKCSDVITCAAPNYGAYSKHNLPNKDYESAVVSRIDHVLFSAYIEGVKVLILGAFGCGVFGNDPDYIAKVMHDLLETKYKGVFSKVVFAIPDNKNYGAFKKYYE